MEKLFKHPWLIVGLIAGISLFFAFQLPRAELDNNNLRFVPQDDEARLVSAYIDDTFGSSLFILVGLERKYGTVFDRDFLMRIRDYVDRIREIEIVGKVNSIINTDYITGDGDALVVEPLVGEDFSGTLEEITELKRRVLSWDLYRQALISDDFSATQIMIPLEITAENAGHPDVVASFLEIRDIARDMFHDLAVVYVTGMPVLSATINEAVRQDLLLLVPVVIGVVLVIVFLPLRRISFVILSLLAVLIAVIWSIGAMPLVGIKLSVISTVLPVILIAVGSSYGLHLIIHYLEAADQDFSTMSREAHRELVLNLVRTIRKPLFLAALTTMVSFFAFCFTQVLPIREFGYFSGFGVAVAFLITLTLIPAILIIRGPRALRKLKFKSQGIAQESRIHQHIAAFFSATAKKTYLVLGVTGALLLVSLYGASQLIIDNVFLEYFKPDTDINTSDNFIRKYFGGSKVISVVVQGESPEILLHPDILGAIDDLNTYLVTKVPETGKVMGFTDLVKRINQVFNVDESPLGLKPQSTVSSTGDFGFGFNDAAEPDFGFSAFSDEDDLPEPAWVGAPEVQEPPATLKELAGLLERALSADQTMDASRLVWEVKKQVNYEGAAYYEIPRDPLRYGKTRPEELQQLVSNYLVLLSGNIESYANDPLEPTAIKTTIQLRTIGQDDTDKVVKVINDYVEAHFPDTVQVVVGGAALVEGSLNNLVVQSLWTSMIIAVVFLFAIMAVCNHSIVAGLLSITPLSLLILINFAIMGLTGIKLNIGTAMISSLSMGIGIDYTVHFLEAYKREYRAAGGKGDFLQKAYRTSGMAIIVDAAATGLGFGVLLLSQFNMLAELGLLIALAMIMSALVGLIIVPALVLWIKPRFVWEERPFFGSGPFHGPNKPETAAPSDLKGTATPVPESRGKDVVEDKKGHLE
ncbi:MAG: MMPL family transporter [Treponema sp.]|jgi:predicted RND superfamily exporter protein|nr:MMPL family transporter [Treponema sp.]